MTSADEKLAIVTGANRGIGLALTRELRQRGYGVLAACRKTTPALTALGVEVVEGVEVTDPDGIERLARAVADRSVDLLINNAGILRWGDKLESLDPSGIREQFEVNALGPLLVTAKLRTRLRKGAKIALITSRMGSIDDNSSGGFYGYRMSKAALNMAGKSLAHDLKAQGVAVAILHPGMVKTDMVGDHGQVEPEQAAQSLLARIDALTLATSGSFWHANGERLPW
ncbi:MAG TPA: SDR family oxidoreductase [Polyangiaceae bacterium]|nr:SDR family oxidoreductase [Polyangiaceae bacterium]